MNAMTSINQYEAEATRHSPERALWQQVLLAAFVDATRKDHDKAEGRLAITVADRWIRGKGRDFCTVCALAGMDPDFLHDAYVAGRIDPAALRAVHLSHAGWVRT